MNAGTTGSLFLDWLLAGTVIAAIIYFILCNLRPLLLSALGLGAVAVGLGLVFLALVGLATGGLAIYENNKTKQCQTVYERVARARDAPADYFGDQMRRDADAEQASCNDLAARLAARAK